MDSSYSVPVGELEARTQGSFLVRVYAQLALAIVLFVVANLVLIAIIIGTLRLLVGGRIMPPPLVPAATPPGS